KGKVERVKGKGQDFVIFNTASAPTGIQLETMEGTVNSSHNNLVYVYINVVDKDGNLCPTAELPLKIETSGAKHIAIAGTGHPYDMKSFRSMTPTSFRGKALLIIQPQDESGQVNIKVTSEGIGSGECTVNFK
ncbi:MAG: glycoside hydrolase family 2, partial [Prevotellaceae bacterium]|nr:glycoside hydrolase family 2 [Prevotellaceae bacterium]